MLNSHVDQDLKSTSRSFLLQGGVEGAKNWDYPTQHSKGPLSQLSGEEKCDVKSTVGLAR